MRDKKLCKEIEGLTDQEILDLLMTNEDVLECIYIRHRTYCLRFIMNKGALQEEAEDLYQDAVIVLMEKIRHVEFVLTSSFQTYLVAICKNKFLAKCGSKEKKLTDSLESQTEEKFHDWYEDEDEESKENLEKVLKAYNVLKENGDKCYERLQLFYFEKMSNIEIASKLGLKDANTTKNLINRCRDTLKKMIGLI